MFGDRPSGAWIQIGDRRLFLMCTGQGTPTVLLEAGLGSTSEEFAFIQSEVSKFMRACSYDRAGLGKSDPAPVPRTCQDQVEDLHSLLAAAHIDPPLILVGHSWGGLNVRLYASLYPQEVAGMLLIDAAHEDKYDHFESVLSDELAQRMWASVKDPYLNDEKIDRIASIDQVRAARQAFDFPLLVLTRGISSDEPSSIWPEELNTIEMDLQRDFLKLSRKSKQIIAERSWHYIHKSQPELVINAIREVVEMARERGSMGSPELE
jgi:pimeloyl-ACP methyl ester carboxylesterase